MCLNHILLPVSIAVNNPDTNLYRGLVWSKRITIALIIAAGYGFYLVIELHEGLASLGLISFVAAIQLLPGVIGLLSGHVLRKPAFWRVCLVVRWSGSLFLCCRC